MKKLTVKISAVLLIIFAAACGPEEVAPTFEEPQEVIVPNVKADGDDEDEDPPVQLPCGGEGQEPCATGGGEG